MQAALKRGLDYGILKKTNGHYFLNTDVDLQQLASNFAPMERSRRRRRRSRRRRSRGRRRRRSRRRSRRGRRRSVRMKRMGCTNCRCASKKARDSRVLESNTIEAPVSDENMCAFDKDSDVERRSRHSKCRVRSLSRSRSSANSDRDPPDDRQAIPDQD